MQRSGPKQETQSPGASLHHPAGGSLGSLLAQAPPPPTGGAAAPPLATAPGASANCNAMASTDQDSEDGNGVHSGDEMEGDGDDMEFTRLGKRKRPLSVSCELCKQRKVKCDRGQPSCGWCSRNGALCEYKERKKPGLRAGYGKELEQRLDRLEEIQRTHSQIIEAYMAASAPAGHHLQQHHSASTPSIHLSNPSVPSVPSDQGTPREPGSLFRPAEPMRTPHSSDPSSMLFQQPKPPDFAPPSQAVDFGGALGQPSAQGLQHGFHHQPHPRRQSQNLPGVHHVQQAAQQQPGMLPGTDYFPQHEDAKMQSPGTGLPPLQAPLPPASGLGAEQDLPPYDLLYSLVDLYFRHIHTWCPILHRKNTVERLFNQGPLDEADRVLLHAIVATTLRFSTDPRLSADPVRRAQYHDTSKRKVFLYGLDNLSVRSLQALVILALDVCGDSHGPPSWNVMALITRAVVQLGLAVETSSFSVSPNYQSIYTLRAMILPDPRDFIEEEERRRLFWMVYLLDRYATIVTAFDFSLDERHIDRRLPCRDEMWAKNQRVETRWYRTGQPGDDPRQRQQGQGQGQLVRGENLGPFAHYVDILSILSQIHCFLKEPVDISALPDVERWQMRYKQLDQLLTQWQHNLPPEFSNLAKLYHQAGPPGGGGPATAPGVGVGGGSSSNGGSSNSAGGTNGNKAGMCAWVMLHATFYTTIIRLHSSAAYPTTRSAIFSPSYNAIQRCQLAVENIAVLGEYVISHSLLNKLGPPFAFTLWVAARLLLVHGSTVEHVLSPRISFFVNTLREMGSYWPVAGRYSGLLQRVLDEYAALGEGAVAPTGTGVGAGPGSSKGKDGVREGNGGGVVKILADMRRTAFDLDWLISHQPRHTGGSNNHHHTVHNGAAGPATSMGLHPGGAQGVASDAVLGPGPMSRMPSLTPARTPAPNELEYLDLFDFFNYPRLPPGNGDGGFVAPFPGGGQMVDASGVPGQGQGQMGPAVTAEYINFGTFTVDANRDWL